MSINTGKLDAEKLIRAGEDGFEKLYKENRDKFLGFARKFNLSEEENVDVYQDAFVIFYDNVLRGKVQEFSSSVATYLFGIGKNLIYERLKKRKKELNYFNETRKQNGTQKTADIAYERKELNDRQKLLADHFRNLGAKCKQLLNLYYYRGFTIKEIVAYGGYKNENVVKSQKSRCLKMLKDKVKQNTPQL